jgi:hypothetical protein
MKRLILLFGIILISISVSAQYFWQPVKNHPYFDQKLTKSVDRISGIWLVRLSAGVIADELKYNKVSKVLEQQAFNKMGLGVSWNHYKDNAGNPYNDFSVNGFLFVPSGATPTNMSIAVTASVFQFLQAGINLEPALFNSDYFPVSLLVGLKYSF